MKTTHLLRASIFALLTMGLVAFNCTGYDNDWSVDDPYWGSGGGSGTGGDTGGVGGDTGGGDTGGGDTGGGDTGGGDTGGSWEAGPACDPDGVAPCPDDFFYCYETEGGKRCEGQNDATPDGGDWDCYEEGTTIVCRGDHMPPSDGFWECEELGDHVVCRAHGYVPLDDSVGDWNCWYEGDRRVCEEGGGQEGPGDEGTGGDVGGGEGSTDTGGSPEEDSGSDRWDDWFPDNNGDGLPDGLEDLFGDLLEDIFDGIFGGGDNPGDDGPGDDFPGDDGPDDTPGDDWPDDTTEESCVCVPGAWRYCDTPTYCRWGVQFCDPDGMDWGRCDEVGAIPASCADYGWYSRSAEECCIESGLCCQDMWDLDLDGDTWESLGACEDIVCG